MTLGRSSGCDIQLPFDVVSSHHLTFERDGPNYRVRDEGSTNGLKLDGAWIEANDWQVVRDGMSLRIVDVQIDVQIEESLTADVGDLTLAQTGTLARDLLGDALEEDGEDLAYFEVIDGPASGCRFELPDDVTDATIGTADDALVSLPDGRAPEKAANVAYAADGFVLQAMPTARVEYNGTPIDGQITLSDGDTLQVGKCRLNFVDPLESQLEDLGGLEGVPAHGTTPADGGEAAEASAASGEPDELSDAGSNAAAADGGSALDVDAVETADGEEAPSDRQSQSADPDGSAQWGLLETVLLLVTVLFVLLVVLVLLVTFEVV